MYLENKTRPLINNMQLTGLVINVFKHVVVSKTRNGVTGNEKPRNRIFFLFVFSFNLLLLTSLVCLPFLLFVFFKGKENH